MCMGVLIVCKSVCHTHTVPLEDRKEHQIFWNWGFRWL